MEANLGSYECDKMLITAKNLSDEAMKRLTLAKILK
jgi:hypothetical protein